MIVAKHEGLYYRVNKRKEKVFCARFAINKKPINPKLNKI